MWAPVLPLLQALLLARVSAGTDEIEPLLSLEQQHRTGSSRGAPAGCRFEGRLFPEGAALDARDACLRCRCARGAVTCRRRACLLPEPPPEPPPARCPRPQCREGAPGAGRAALAAQDAYPEDVPAAHVLPVCVEEGAAYAAGSAMRSDTACEQCFCLGGARRCVRPRCLPPPRGCRARAAPGACCPHGYRCDHDHDPADDHTDTPHQLHSHDCSVGGRRVAEGERVAPPGGAECARCYCLRGEVRCQALACAPTLMGCRPLLEPGQCCPHQYQCVHQQRQGLSGSRPRPAPDDTIVSIRNPDRTYRNVPSDEKQTTATTKMKRNTSDPPAPSRGPAPPAPPAPPANATAAPPAPTTAGAALEDATEQPEGSVRIIINGTINCTAELSSATLAVNLTEANEFSSHVEVEDPQPRAPAAHAHAHAYDPNDIITDRNYNGDFDENESYVINVTSSLISSLRTNHTQPALAQPAAAHDVTEKSEKTSGDYEYTYGKPTLPPSLPNLKIIPFVAADAVVDETSPQEAPAYPALEGDDKYPVYYPGDEAKDVPFATRGQDLFSHTQFPIFLSKKVEPPHYQLAGHQLHLTDGYPTSGDIMASLREFTAPPAPHAPHDGAPLLNEASTAPPGHGAQLALGTPAAGLFSPPMETEGGFVPQAPGIDGDYYAYPGAAPGPPALHLTTSMQLDTAKGCVSGEGRRVHEGESISVGCSVCTCGWGELRCSPRACAPAGCGDPACGRVNASSTPAAGRPSADTRADSVTESIRVTGTSAPATSEPTLNSGHTNVPSSNTLDTGLAGEDTQTTTAAGAHRPRPGADGLTDADGGGSQEYEDEDEDEGFSFGSVLKLLLSENYETTTSAPADHSLLPAAAPPTAHVPTTMTPSPKPAGTPAPTAPTAPTGRVPYTAAKKQHTQNTINRIDHLVLGDTTAIKLTTPRPATVPPFKPIVTRKPSPVKLPPSQKPPSPPPSRPPGVTNKSDFIEYTADPAAHGSSPGGLGPGLLKLAGCNIYGQMYRVGRIIAELSTPCQECRCTELGVQCTPLRCEPARARRRRGAGRRGAGRRGAGRRGAARGGAGRAAAGARLMNRPELLYR